ncbi:COP9 signalosome complex subunit 3 [Penicillium canariense]|uniref:COP9 signalosome complex subunit 3 n=1 Tax=Penicillium canariense TaxID=189055 RepID=A0A9W9HM42_9EURO|nr:COP9 signalosome complex subunit 3 [Penicillium canariense]KAJ5150976.1 COP9 signalosome complex subunit 3 [Penicillium canariense]
MDIVEGLLTKSAQLREAARLSDEGYDRQIRANVTSLRHVMSRGSLSSNDSLFDHFDPGADSLAYLFLLHAQIHALQEASCETVPAGLLPPGRLWSRMVSYLKAFDPVQVRYAGQEWRQLVELVGQAAQMASKPILAVRLVRDAMLRLDPSCAVFTSTHLLLVQLCLRARAYAYALPVLNKFVCHFPTSTSHATSRSSVVPCATHDSSLSFITEASGLSSNLTYKDYLRYFLYGGMVYSALKKWCKAAHFFGVVISMPATGSISMIMVEAYKKWVLVGLLDKGKLCSHPSMIASNVVKIYQSLAKPYVNLAQTFERGDRKALEAEIDAARDIWCADNNMGLVSQVMNAYSKHTIIGVKKTFAALTVTAIAEQASPAHTSDEATESIIASLIMSGAMEATLVQLPNRNSSTMLRFLATPSFRQLSRESRVQTRLMQERHSLEALVDSLDESNRHMGLSDEFVDSIQKGQAWARMSDVNPGMGEDAGLEIDEDLMGEVS